MDGSNTIGEPGVYGTKGVPAVGNMPGGRMQSVSWTDPSGNLWLFGGYGDAIAGHGGGLNDLWKFAPSTGEWTWISGSETGNQAGVYGTLGVSATDNVPGVRIESVSWTESDGDLWLFGGFGYDSNGTKSDLNDLWKYTLSTREWTWMGGSSKVNQSGAYGTQGVFARNNAPGARFGAVSWTDISGNFWLSGGYGSDENGATGDLNDLWKYTPSTGEWIWVSGSNLVNQYPVYGTRGVPAIGNIPGARQNAVGWRDISGNLWLFGGVGLSEGSGGNLNDLWEYKPSTGEWIWMGGSETGDQTGVYGTLGVSTTGNVPGGRSDAISWTSASGNLWLFGGWGYDAKGKFDYLDDLWEYKLSTGEWTWAGGAKTVDQLGVYGTQGVPATTNTPGDRYSAVAWADPDGNLWLFGGFGYVATGVTCRFSDLWKYAPTDAVPVVAVPTFSLTSGTYTSAQTVKIKDATTGATIHYTTNNATPTAGSPKYSSPISVSETTTIKAIAIAAGHVNSSVASETYTIHLTTATPTFKPIAGNYSVAQNVAISDATLGATIHYTLNGAEPTESSTVYVAPIRVAVNQTIRAIAIDPSHANSAVAIAPYKIGLPAAAGPKFSVVTGTYKTTQTVTITDATVGASVYYTTNGSAPTTASTKYTVPLTLAKSTTLKAVASSPTHSNSAITVATYTFSTSVANGNLEKEP